MKLSLSPGWHSTHGSPASASQALILQALQALEPLHLARILAVFVFVCCFETLFLAQAGPGLKFLILLPPPLEC